MHEWQNRVLIVKTSDTKSNKYQEQFKEFEDSNDEMIDRKLILYSVVVDDFKMTDFKNPGFTESGKVSADLKENVLNKNENFEIILIGLDGGIKLQQKEVLSKKDLFRIIDSMPMRSNELRRRANKQQ